VTPATARLYVYGVLAASEATIAIPAGVTGRQVRTVTDDGLAALVSDLSADSLAAAREVRAHWRVLEEASRTATVLPVRFGTVMDGERAVREQLLEANAERLQSLLGELAGRVQLSVKGEYDEESLLREVVASSPSIAALRERVRTMPDAAGYYDRIQLGEMVAAQIEQRREDDAQTAMARLAPMAVQSRSQEPSSANQAFDLAFLVQRDAVEDFGRAVADLGETLAQRIRLRFVGPLPPFSFVEAELSAEGVAWA
jgi:hypothetical protein